MSRKISITIPLNEDIANVLTLAIQKSTITHNVWHIVPYITATREFSLESPMMLISSWVVTGDPYILIRILGNYLSIPQLMALIKLAIVNFYDDDWLIPVPLTQFSQFHN